MISETELSINRLRDGWSLDDVLEQAQLPELGKFMMKFIYRKSISVDALAGLADLNKSTVYRICDNRMHPSSNVLIRLSRVLDMSIEDTQKLLKCGNLPTLSGERKRDLIIMNGIINNDDIMSINDDLIAHDFPDLFSNR